MNNVTQQLADALRAIDSATRIDSDTVQLALTSLSDIRVIARQALAAYDAQQAQAHNVADSAWSANAGSVWDHTGKWIADCSIEHAARIVQCVNAHNALVSALRGCVERLGVVIESDTDDALHGASPDDVAAYEAGRAALAVAGVPKDNEVDEKVIWSDDLAAVLEAASEASAAPLTWFANREFSPEQTKAWLCNTVDNTVEDGAFSEELHGIAEEESGLIVAFTGCGPKSAANAKFLIWCAHFILKHREPLTDHAATVAELRADRDSWRDQAEERIRNWHEEHDARKAAERRVGELEAALLPLADATFDEFCSSRTEREAPDDAKVSYPEEDCHITFGMIRNARKALTGADPT